MTVALRVPHRQSCGKWAEAGIAPASGLGQLGATSVLQLVLTEGMLSPRRWKGTPVTEPGSSARTGHSVEDRENQPIG